MSSKNTMFTASRLTAGTYTIRYTLAAGYTESEDGVILSDSTGADTGAMTITLDGATGYETDLYYLTGVVVSTSSGGDSGNGSDDQTITVVIEDGSGGDMSMTDILLIVVILVICILVAMRLFRS